jgi:multidrug efflux pump subunit AcrB
MSEAPTHETSPGPVPPEPAADVSGFTGWMRAHSRSLLLVLGLLAAAGVYAGLQMPVALFPQVEFPRIVVSLDAGDRSAERMAIEVTTPLEQAMRALPGVRGIRSATSRGSAEVSVDFGWGHDMAIALLDVQTAVSGVLPGLPAGSQFEVRRMDPTVFPVLGYSLVSTTQSPVALRDMAEFQVRPLLATVEGVARVDVQGGATGEVRVEVDPARLAAVGLTVQDVADAVAASNVITAVGRLEDRGKLYLAFTQASLDDVSDVPDILVRAGPEGVVRLGDVATVRPAQAPVFTRVTADGKPAVLVLVYQQPGGNTVQISRDVQRALAGFPLPPGTVEAEWYDQSDLILASASSVRDAVLIGVVLAALVLFAFLRNAKITLVAVVAVPVVLATTALVLRLLGQTFNVMTLGGMAAAVGLVIDDVIVMVEHVVKTLRGEADTTEAARALVGLSPRQRVLRAAREFTRPLAASSAATLIIHIPPVFLSGVTGEFFKALSLTLASALVVSFLVAWVAVPLVSVGILTPKDAEERPDGRLLTGARRGYGRVGRRLLARPVLVLVGVVPLVLAGYLSFQALGSEFLPPTDEGGFVFDYLSPPGTSLEETDRMVREIEAVLQATPEVATYSRRTGLQLGGALTEADEGDFFVRLKPQPRRGIDEVMDDVRGRVEARVPGLEIELVLLMEDLIGDLTAVPEPVEVQLFGDSPEALTATAERVSAGLEGVDGLVDVADGVVPAGDALDVVVDPTRAGLQGVTPADLSAQLANLLDGNVATQVQQGPKLVDVRVWVAESERATALDVGRLLLRAPDGHLVRVTDVATVVPVTGQPQIARADLRRMVAVTGRISGRDLGSTIRDVRALLDRPGTLPLGVTYRLGGLYAQQQEAFRGLLGVFGAATALVFLLLLALYERFRVALAMVLTALLSLAAICIGLWAWGSEIDISSMMGIAMIVGIVTEVSVFYVEELRVLPPEMGRAEGLLTAGANRLRPIAMTTLAAILALLPLALGVGEGAGMLKPLAVAIVSGLVAQLPLALLVLPALLVLFRADLPTGPLSRPEAGARPSEPNGPPSVRPLGTALTGAPPDAAA